MTTVFNRETLLKEIEKVWGSDGAHAEVYRSLLEQFDELQQKLDKAHVSGSLPLTEDDIRFRCTRFAHECRLKGVVTNNDTVELYDKTFGGNDR